MTSFLDLSPGELQPGDLTLWNSVVISVKECRVFGHRTLVLTRNMELFWVHDGVFTVVNRLEEG